ncbi:peptide deformylase [Methylophilaceae bacterium 11]|jgi:peptide deformylase|uniref:peptide deformylase n=1 Tax=unclassified Methylotenera TaxID=2643294 RepID=UPI00036C0EED|nr:MULTISPECIES: peptide deformylase [unclassified Methylotenera]EUJ09445.1 peptide deformylase [Methylophilaceae bacterium 11]
MALLSILNYPDPRLHTVAKPVTVFNADLKRLVQDMRDTMYDAPGIGLAATQVDRHIQLIVIDTSKEQDDLLVLINPKIVAQSGTQTYEEGCLSVPGIYETVTRAEKVTVEAQNVEGERFTLEAEGLLSVCVQHEMDHLKGKVFVEYLSPLKRNRIKNKMVKHAREITRNNY